MEYVLEGRRRSTWGEEWVLLANIGPDISDGVIDQYSSEQFALCDLRVRKLDATDGVQPSEKGSM